MFSVRKLYYVCSFLKSFISSKVRHLCSKRFNVLESDFEKYPISHTPPLLFSKDLTYEVFSKSLCASTAIYLSYSNLNKIRILKLLKVVKKVATPKMHSFRLWFQIGLNYLQAIDVKEVRFFPGVHRITIKMPLLTIRLGHGKKLRRGILMDRAQT